jgi:hypothetical protein
MIERSSSATAAQIVNTIVSIAVFSGPICMTLTNSGTFQSKLLGLLFQRRLWVKPNGMK